MRRALVVAALLLAGRVIAQPANGWQPLGNGWSELKSSPATGTVTTTGTLAAGQVALGSGATSITGDAGLTYSGTWTGFVLGLSDLRIGRASASTFYFNDSGGSRASLDAYGFGDTVGANTFLMGTPALGLQFRNTYKIGWSSTSQQNGGTDLALSRASAGTLLVEDGSGNARDVQARTGTFGTSVVTPYINPAGAALTIADNASNFFGFANNAFYGNTSSTLGKSDNAWATTFTTNVSGGAAIGTNIAGTNVVIQPQAGTGSATGSSLIFQTPTATGSGTTAQTQTTRLTVSEGGTVFGGDVANPVLVVRSSTVAGTPRLSLENSTSAAIMGISGNSNTGEVQIGNTAGSGFFTTVVVDNVEKLRVTSAAVIPAVPIRLKGYTVATLPAGTVGDTAYCTDLTAPTFMAVAVGGGAVIGKVFYDGTNWITQ